jgi:hypothetical protein
MKSTPRFYALTLLFALALSSCGENSEEKTPVSEQQQDTTENEEKNDLIIYTIDNCDSFIEGIDFSSLCFTEEQHPAYKNNMSGERRCQYQLLDDQVTFVVVHKDYANYDSEKIEMDQYLTKASFQRTGKMLYAKTKKITTLGEDAYIGYEQTGGDSDVSLHIRFSNIAITIEVDPECCGSSDEEILKLGQLLVDHIKK